MKRWLWLVAAVIGCSRTGLELSERGLDPAPAPTASAPDDSACDAPAPVCGALRFDMPSSYRCALGDLALASETRLAVSAGSSLHLIQGETALEAYRFSPAPAERTWTFERKLIARRNRIAAMRSFSSWQGAETTVELVLVDARGELLFEERLHFTGPPPSSLQVAGNDEDMFVFSLRLGLNERLHRVVALPEVRTWSETIDVAADPGADGWTLVDDGLEPSAVDFDWRNLLGSAQHPSCYRARPSYWAVAVLSPGIAYAIPDGAELVYERGLERCRVALAGAWPRGHRWPSIVASNRYGWTLSSWFDQTMRLVAANVATGETTPSFVLTPPPGREFGGSVESTGEDIAIDHQGATVLPTMRVDGDGTRLGRLYRTFDGSAWEPLGEEEELAPSRARRGTVVEANGTYLFNSHRPSESRAGRREFTQVIRRDRGVIRDLPRAHSPYSLSEDGSCVAAFGAEGKLEVLDVATGVTHHGPQIESGDATAVIAFVPEPSN
jgi:hypothetical protein